LKLVVTARVNPGSVAIRTPKPLAGGVAQGGSRFRLSKRLARRGRCACDSLGHADLNTTLGMYGHRDQSGLGPNGGTSIVPPRTCSQNGSTNPKVEAAGIEPASAVVPA